MAQCCKALSGFIATTILLALSTAIALYIYATSSNLYTAYRPGLARVYGHIVCYNITDRSVMLSSSVPRCGGRDTGSRYLCVVRAPTPMNISVVLENHVMYVYTHNGCVLLLDDLPLYVYGVGNGVYAVLEVKTYDPWPK